MPAIVKTIKSMPLVMPVLKHYYNRKFINNQDDNLFRGIYRSFPEAEQHIPGTRPAGYDNADSAKMYKNWIGQIREHDYPVIYWLDKIKTEIDSLFDYGGHIGFLYYGYIRYLTFSEQFKWWVYDVPAVVNEGRKIAQEQGKTQLHFCDDVNPAGNVDVFMASGSLQYLQEPLYETLDKLKSDKLKHVIVNMTPMHGRHEFFTVNSIGTAFCPYWIQHKQIFLDAMQARGWQLVDSWENMGKHCKVPFHSEYTDGIRYLGMYFRK